ncbi:MAG TPA: hypothetical protein VL092_03020 [Chitinophagaceae bacterium]|nr:hypothetical protein [Chitinophagaceae bacterium]
MIPQSSAIFDITLTEKAKAHLLETCRWTKFLAILTFILIGIMMTGLLAVFATGSMAAVMSNGFSALGAVGAFLVMTLLVVLYWYPSYMLYRFSVSIKSGILHNNQQMIEDGFRYEKNMYRFLGILTIIIILVYLVIILSAVVSAL